MNKIIWVILMLIVTGTAICAEAKTIRTVVPVNNSYASQIYGKDLTTIEKSLFGTAFGNESVNSRLNRIENRLFSQIYTNLDFSQRVNQVVSAYNNSYTRNYLPAYANSPQFSFRNMFRNFVGVPTGYTPPIVNTPFNDYGYPAGISRGYSTNRGYGFNNYIPANVGAGIHILD